MFKQKDNTDAIVAAIFVRLFLKPEEVQRNVTTQQEWILELSRKAEKLGDLSPEEREKRERDIWENFDLTGEEEVPPLIFGDMAMPEARTRVTAKLIMPCYHDVLAGIKRARENAISLHFRNEVIPASLRVLSFISIYAGLNAAKTLRRYTPRG